VIFSHTKNKELATKDSLTMEKICSDEKTVIMLENIVLLDRFKEVWCDNGGNPHYALVDNFENTCVMPPKTTFWGGGATKKMK